MKSIALFISLLFLNCIASASTERFFSDANIFFQTYVQNGKVDYDAIAKNKTSLNEVIKLLGKLDLTQENADNVQAVYINAYNLFMIQLIVKHDVQFSPLDMEGIFTKPKVNIAGKRITLNDIEKVELAKFNDPRIHFVLVCGANGCPKIADFAFIGDNLNAALDMRTKLAINDFEFVQVNHANKSISASQIFEWYISDFGGSKSTTIDFLNKYLRKKVAANYSLSYYKYDWSLNKKKD